MKAAGDHVEFEPGEVTPPLEGERPRGLASLLYPEGTTFTRAGVRYIVRGGVLVALTTLPRPGATPTVEIEPQLGSEPKPQSAPSLDRQRRGKPSDFAKGKP